MVQSTRNGHFTGLGINREPAIRINQQAVSDCLTTLIGIACRDGQATHDRTDHNVFVDVVHSVNVCVRRPNDRVVVHVVDTNREGLRVG